MRRAALSIGLGLLVALAALAAYSWAAVRAAEAAYPPLGEFVAAEGARLHYVSGGLGAPVVLVHGSDGVLQDFTTSIVDAVAAEYRALAFDRPGHGYSERPADAPLTLALNARLLRGAVGALGVERPVLVGHSYGGAVALQYALDYPADVAGVVLLGGAAYPGDGLPHPRVLLPAVPLVGPLYLHALLVPLDRIAPGADGAPAADAVPPAYVGPARALGARPAQAAAHAEALRAVNADLAALAPRYGALRVPLTIIAGGADRVVDPERHAYPLHRAVPHARLVILPEAGHWAHHTHPAAVLDAIRQVRG